MEKTELYRPTKDNCVNPSVGHIKKLHRRQWLVPVILATWEAEIRKTGSKPALANSL
jgi:hypothetical protein